LKKKIQNHNNNKKKDKKKRSSQVCHFSLQTRRHVTSACNISFGILMLQNFN